MQSQAIFIPRFSVTDNTDHHRDICHQRRSTSSAIRVDPEALTILLPADKVYSLFDRADHKRCRRARLLRNRPGALAKRLRYALGRKLLPASRSLAVAIGFEATMGRRKLGQRLDNVFVELSLAPATITIVPQRARLTKLSIKPSLPSTTISPLLTLTSYRCASFMGSSRECVPSCRGKLNACCISSVRKMISPPRTISRQQSPRLAMLRVESCNRARRHVDEP